MGGHGQTQRVVRATSRRGAGQGVRGGLGAADWAACQVLLQPFDRRAEVDRGQVHHQVDRSAAAMAPPVEPRIRHRMPVASSGPSET